MEKVLLPEKIIDEALQLLKGKAEVVILMILLNRP